MDSFEEEKTTISKESLVMLLDILQATISVIIEETSIEGVYGLTNYESEDNVITWDELLLFVNGLRYRINSTLH